MNDRELLELAAKAAGVDVSEDRPGKLFLPNPKGSCFLGKEWNPLSDDGDALRLATRLHIDLEFYKACVEAIWIDEALSETHTVVEYCDEEVDGLEAKEAATRRAIVRAAAEIARAAA